MTPPTHRPTWPGAPLPVGAAVDPAWAAVLDPAVERRLVSEQLFHSVIVTTPRTLALGLLAALTLATVATWRVCRDTGQNPT